MSTEGLKIVIKRGTELSKEELEHVTNAKDAEWETGPIDQEQKNEIFVLVKNSGGDILSHGQLVEINGVIFNGETFNIIGIGGIIANIRGQGYGRILMEGILKYLKKHGISAVGFTGIPEFYRKCGFSIATEALPRFVHMEGSEKHTNKTDEHLFYYDARDQFMKKVLENSKAEVYLPRHPDW